MIVLFDGIKIGIVRKGGLGKEISCVAPEVWIVAKHPEVHEKAVEVRKIKSGKRHIQADIRLRDIVPKQEPPFRQPLLQPIKGTKDQMKGIAVGSLALYKARLADAVVDILEDLRAQRINFSKMLFC